LALALEDAKAGIVAVLVDESFDVRSLKVGPADGPPVHQVTTTFDFARNMNAGAFDVYVSVGLRDGTPVIALPLEDGDGQRRYKLGRIEVKNSAD
jgi:hypothetical protein